MTRTKERTPQLKTLERLVNSVLHKQGKTDPRFLSCFQYMYAHFADEDFLHDCKHKELLDAIYGKEFYKTHTVGALQMKFHIDNKTLLEARKNYLHLLTKQYLALDSNTDNYRLLLYTALKELQAA